MLSRSSHVFSAAGSSLKEKLDCLRYLAELRDVPQVVRRIHPNLNHSNECANNILLELCFVVACTCDVYGAIFALELRDHDVDGGLVVLECNLWVIAELREIEMSGRWGRIWGIVVWGYQSFKGLDDD